MEQMLYREKLLFLHVNNLSARKNRESKNTPPIFFYLYHLAGSSGLNTFINCLINGTGCTNIFSA